MLNRPLQQARHLSNTVELVRQELKMTMDTKFIGIILGSAWGFLAELLMDKRELLYRDIPHCPQCSAPGHDGKLVWGKLNGVWVLMACGRHHCYEGFTPLQAVFLPRLMALLGAKVMILTNAAGSIEYEPGELVAIKGHINISGLNCLTGPHVEVFGPRFPDMTQVYSPALLTLAYKVAQNCNIPVHTNGKYFYMCGPSYETPDEIAVIRQLSGTHVGMSTVHEAVALNAMGIPVFGLSCMTNMAAGMAGKITNEEVIAELQKQQGSISTFMSAFIPAIATELQLG